MIELLTGPLVAMAIVTATAAWFLPWQAISFLILGTVPYYAALHVLGIQTSAALTGCLFLAAGVGAIIRLASRKRLRGKIVWRPLLLFTAFVVVWYIRWIQDPPPISSREDVGQFAERSYLLMVAFAIVPFFSGVLVHRQDDVRAFLRACAFWGGVTLAVGLAYWIAGMPNLGPEWSEKWEPIPSMTGIIFALETGLGCLALLGLPTSARPVPKLLLKVFVPVAGAALILRIGQRGPFLAYGLGLFAFLLMSEIRNRVQRALAMLGAVAAISGVATYVGEHYTSRSFAARAYTAESNEDRLVLYAKAATIVTERPVLGWGGSLVGESVGDDEWKYLHVMLLDPLIETGIAGAVPFWVLFAIVFRAAWRLRRNQSVAWDIRAPLLAMFVAVILEGQVSGHVSGAKHVWLLTGILSVSAAWAPGFAGRSRAGDERCHLMSQSPLPHGGA